MLVPDLGRTEGTGSCLKTSLVAVLLQVLERRMLLLKKSHCEVPSHPSPQLLPTAVAGGVFRDVRGYLPSFQTGMGGQRSEVQLLSLQRESCRGGHSPLLDTRESLQCLKETRLQCFTAHGKTFSILPLKEKKEKTFCFFRRKLNFPSFGCVGKTKGFGKKKSTKSSLKKKKKAKLFLPHQQHLFLFWAILRTNKDMYKNRKIIGKSPRKTAEEALGISHSWQ